MAVLEAVRFCKIDFTENLSDRKILKFPHCADVTENIGKISTNSTYLNLATIKTRHRMCQSGLRCGVLDWASTVMTSKCRKSFLELDQVLTVATCAITGKMILSFQNFSSLRYAAKCVQLTLSFRFYVKSILENLEVVKLLFLQFLGL